MHILQSIIAFAVLVFGIYLVGHSIWAFCDHYQEHTDPVGWGCTNVGVGDEEWITPFWSGVFCVIGIVLCGASYLLFHV